MSEQELRPTFVSAFMDMASTLSQRSTCQRLKVGTIITTVDYREISIGYNGNAVGLSNQCDNLDKPGNCGCLHSEENAIINCKIASTVPKIVFVTHLPCYMCAKRLLQLRNVVRIWYDKEYRLTDSVELFKQAGIDLQQFDHNHMWEPIVRS
jgi:dCMP deaminase